MLAKAAALSAVAMLIAASAHAQPAPPAPPMAPAAPPAPPAPPAPLEGWSGAHFTGVTWDAHDSWSDKDRAKFEAKMKRLDEKLAASTSACRLKKARARCG